MKQGLIGCIQRGGIPTSAGSSPGGFVIEVQWATLEPSEGTLDTSTIDAALAAAQRLGLPGIKVRLMGGIHAPGWLQNRVGTVSGYIESQSGLVYTIPKAWVQAYTDAYVAVQRLLAAKYDSNPLVRTAVVTGPTSVYAEPFQFCNPTSAAVLKAAGYTDAAFLAGLTGMIDGHTVWSNTPSALAFNAFKSVNGGQSYTELDTIMAHMRATLGADAIIENNSWRSTFAWTDPLYAVMVKHGGPLCVQTATTSRIGDVHAAFASAVAQPALVSIEIPSASGLTAAELAAYTATMAANAGHVGPPPGGPPVPTGLRASNLTATDLDLSWSPSAGATSYTPYESGRALTATAATSVHISGLIPGTQYHFAASASNASGTSALSTPLSVTTPNPSGGTSPPVPTGLVASHVTTTSLDLAWTASAGASGYTALDGGTAVANPTTPLAHLTGLLPGSTHVLTVEAFNSIGRSAASPPLTVHLPTAPPPPPPGNDAVPLLVAAGAAGAVVLLASRKRR